MKKLYIFLTYNIARVGGIETYVAGKTAYLKENGWAVKVLYHGFHHVKSLYENLDEFEDGAFPEFTCPPFQMSRKSVVRSLDRMVRYIGDCSGYDTVYMESHDDRLSQWGELIAERIGAKHLIILLNERYRGADRYYADKIDFYNFKHERGEVRGDVTLARLFEGFREITEADYRPFHFNESPVADVRCPAVEALKKADWNICYIGRFIKPYVPAILQGVKRFAAQHSDRQIQLLIVGDTSARGTLAQDTFTDSENVSVVELGNLIPIPRSLYRKVDVVIAGSGSARCSAQEGALTIIADPDLCKATGLLGYETRDTVFWNGVSPLTGFDEALERTLIQKVYENLTYDYREPTVEECCRQNFEAFQNCGLVREYYGLEKMCAGKKSPKRVAEYRFKTILYRLAPSAISKWQKLRAKVKNA